jgi:chemotaxis protein MotB
MQFLVQQGIDPRRIRMSVAGSNEPLHAGTRPDMLLLNPRVEVHALDEVVKDFHGSVPPKNSADEDETPK